MNVNPYHPPQSQGYSPEYSEPTRTPWQMPVWIDQMLAGGIPAARWSLALFAAALPFNCITMGAAGSNRVDFLQWYGILLWGAILGYAAGAALSCWGLVAGLRFKAARTLVVSLLGLFLHVLFAFLVYHGGHPIVFMWFRRIVPAPGPLDPL